LPSANGKWQSTATEKSRDRNPTGSMNPVNDRLAATEANRDTRLAPINRYDAMPENE
jgi:hypothetical protein